MQQLKNIASKSYKTLGTMKFAVVIISIFTLALVYGTFMESYHGADFANRLVYKNWWFILIEALMFFSIVIATIDRLPLKKALYGFYTIHAGLIILFAGSVMTYLNGIDGTIELLPNTPATKIQLDRDYLKVAMVDENKAIKFLMPYSAGPSMVNGKYKDFLKVLDYIPYARLSTKWETSNLGPQSIDHGTTYQIFNQNMSQDFTVSLNPSSDFKSTQKMGLLNVHYMPHTLFDCFTSSSKSGFLIWNTEDNNCQSAEKLGAIIDQTDKGSKFLLLKYKNDFLKFFPNFSPLPINDDLTKNTDTPFRAFSLKLFEKKPHLFLFGKKLAYFKKRKKKWLGLEFSDKTPIIGLPWMGFKLKLLEHHEGKYPVQIPEPTLPIQDAGKIVEGDVQAVKISVHGQEYWVRDDAPLFLQSEKKQLRFMITKEDIQLPYQITLKRFKMDTNPGTKTPASYESFVQLLDGRNTKGGVNYHVYMNNPLKYDDFTFYQASYFPISPDQYGSAFSVNFDPGRPVKYAGSLLLVLGSIWHYIIRRKKKKKVA